MEEYHIEDIIQLIIDYSRCHKEFDGSFLFSIRDIYQETGKLTHNQEKSLLNIFRVFNIREWDISSI